MSLANQGTNLSPWYFVVVGLFLIAAWTRHFFIMRRRKQEMREMATRLGLETWPDDSSPRGLSLNGTVFQHWSKLFNVYEGMLNHRQVAILDFRKQAGKSSWSRTIVAVRTEEKVFEGRAFGLEMQQVNDWQLCYSPVGFLHRGKLMDIPEIEELLNRIAHYNA